MERNHSILWICALALFLPIALQAQTVPLADHHQHLLRPATIAVMAPNQPATGPRVIEPISAADLVHLLDQAGIRKALVLSVAYTWGNPGRHSDNEYEEVKAENDWTSAQVAQYPDRLRGFCGLNPLRPYALDELERCANDRYLRAGLKLHFGNSQINLDDRTQVEQLRRVFAAANKNRMAIVIHMRASFSARLPYGAKEARIFINELLPAVPDVPVQIAHLAGGGNPDDPAADEVLGVFVEAIKRNDPRTRRLLFEISGVPGIDLNLPPEKARHIADRIRELGLKRILFGSDTPTGGNFTPRQEWIALHQIPLTDAEFRTIANNVAPYMR